MALYLHSLRAPLCLYRHCHCEDNPQFTFSTVNTNVSRCLYPPPKRWHRYTARGCMLSIIAWTHLSTRHDDKQSKETVCGQHSCGLDTVIELWVRYILRDYRRPPLFRTASQSFYCPVVTVSTTSLTLNNRTFCPHSVFMCFVWIWEQTAIISLYSINWLVFITEVWSVYCAVRTGFTCNV